MNKRGFIGIVIIGVIVLAFLVGAYFGIKYYIRYGDDVENIVCTEEAMICPDGTAVGRVLPDCEFEECPDVIVVDGESCVQEGGSIPVIENPPECCEGLDLIPPQQEEWVGISGFCTANCGDGECGEIETEYNCPVDCLLNQAA
ncbi:MAG: hypothetical protein ABIH72_04930 [archaeon]